MKLLRSRHGRASDASSRDVKKLRADTKGCSSPNFIRISSVAAVSLLVLTLLLSGNYILEHAFQFGKEKRVPYSFNWGDAIELRSQLSAKYNQPPYLPNGILRKTDMSVAEFRDMWDARWPLIITDVVPNWGAFHWSKDFLYKFYSKSNLTVTRTKGQLKDMSGDIMSLAEFYRLTFERTTPTSWAYATDEHFIEHHPPLQLDIGPNKYAEEDFFKQFPEEIRPGSSMLLWGTKYSRSLLHIDPYNWTGSVALLKGTKKWKMWPPNPDNSLNFSRRRSGFPLDCPSFVSNLDFFSKSPPQIALPHRLEGGLQYNLEFEQRAGELLFIPTGWAHQAYNLDETLAISGQFMNRNNYQAVLEEIIQCTNIDSVLPPSFPSMGPREQVDTVLSLIPEELIRAAKYTKAATRQRLMSGEDGGFGPS